MVGNTFWCNWGGMSEPRDGMEDWVCVCVGGGGGWREGGSAWNLWIKNFGYGFHMEIVQGICRSAQWQIDGQFGQSDNRNIHATVIYMQWQWIWQRTPETKSYIQWSISDKTRVFHLFDVCSAVVVFLFLVGLWFTEAILNGPNLNPKLNLAAPTIGYSVSFCVSRWLAQQDTVDG